MRLLIFATFCNFFAVHSLVALFTLWAFTTFLFPSSSWVTSAIFNTKKRNKKLSADMKRSVKIIFPHPFFFFFFILGLRQGSNSATRHVVFWVMDMTHFSPTGGTCPPPSLFLVPAHAGSITCRWIHNIHLYGFCRGAADWWRKSLAGVEADKAARLGE